jgi:sugar O-acyltransferase (sialic acid O-acetyltransferase NeuD family)
MERMSTPIVVVGAGGFGREVIDVIEAMNAAAPEPAWELAGVVDDSLAPANRDRLENRSITYLGTTDDFLASGGAPVSYAVGIGSPAVRRKIALRFDGDGHSGARLIHPSVTMGADVTIGPGTVLCAGVRITTNIAIGQHVHINLNATVGHDTSIGDFVSLNPLASISGDCVIEDDVLVGVGGIVLNGLRLGRGAVVGGAACAVRDVAPETTVVGVPARPLGQR